MEAIDIQGVKKSYFQHHVLEGVDLKIPEGSIYGLLGQNGAGKTTLIRIITRILLEDEGMIFFYGQPLDKTPMAQMGYMPEERGLYKKMKVGEQLLYLAQLKGVTKNDALDSIDTWLERLALAETKNKALEELSKGMQQKIQFIATVIHRPKFIILDEPFSGFDPVNATLLTQEILRLRNEGATILFSTHRMENVEELCNHFAILHDKSIKLQGEKNTLKKRMRTLQFEAVTESPIQTKEGLFQLKEQKKQPDGTVLSLIVPENGSIPTNALVQEILNQAPLVNFHTQSPSVADIFFETVQSHA